MIVHQMLAALQQVFSAGNVTVGNPSGSTNGYGTSGSGIGTGGSYTGGATVRGASIERILSINSVNDFQIQLDGVRTQSFFTGVRVQDGTGVTRTYLTAAATFATGSDSTWSWGTGSSQVWAPGDVGEVHAVEIF